MGHSDQIDHDLANDQRPEKMGSWLKWGMLGWHVAVKPSVSKAHPIIISGRTHEKNRTRKANGHQ